MPIVTASDISKLVDALAAEQDKCTRLAMERAALIEALRPFAVLGVYRSYLADHWRAAEKLLRSIGELGELE